MPDNKIQIIFEALDKNVKKVADDVKQAVSGVGDDLLSNFDPADFAAGMGIITAGVAAFGAAAVAVKKELDEVIELSKEEPELFSEEQLKKVDEYEVALAKLTKTTENYRLELSVGLMGALTDVLKMQEQTTAAMDRGAGVWEARAEAAKKLADIDYAASRDSIEATESFDRALLAMNDTVKISAEQKKNLAQASKEAAEAEREHERAIKEMTKANQSFLDDVESRQKMEDSFVKEQENLNNRLIELEGERNQAIAQGWWENSEKVQGYNEKIEETKAKIQESAEEHEKAQKRIVLGYLEQMLAIDGLDGRETEFLLKKGVEWGIYSEDVIAATRDAMAEVDVFIGRVNAIPSGKTIDITVNAMGDGLYLLGSDVKGGGGTGGGKKIKRRQHGGPVAGGEPVIVGEAGPELFSPPQSGSIIPNNELGGGMDEDRLARKIVSAMMKGMAQQ